MTNPLTPLYDAVAWVIMRLHAGLGAIFGASSGAAWALSIVILVVLMRLLLVPLFIKQMHATRKMTALAPQVAELKKKYKGDKQKLNEETMKLYKENGANPLAGCLPCGRAAAGLLRPVRRAPGDRRGPAEVRPDPGGGGQRAARQDLRRRHRGGPAADLDPAAGLLLDRASQRS